MVDRLNNLYLLRPSSGGVKILLEDLPEEAWTEFSGSQGNYSRLFKSIPWLQRSIRLRANGVASVPYEIYAGDDLISSSDFNLGISLKRLIWLAEASLTIWGVAYFEIVKNLLGKPIMLKYLLPETMKAEISEQDGLIGFSRLLSGRKIRLDVDRVLHIWYDDPFVEVGPGESSPFTAAINSSNVLKNKDEYIAMHFKHGAVKATILAVPPNTPKVEREKLESKWNLLSGIKNAFRTLVVNAGLVNPVVVGSGLDELADINLSTEAREDIAGAMGIPMSILFANAANYATALQDNIHFYDKTIIPECLLLENSLNEQLFNPMGLNLRFTPEKMDVFQEDEERRSASLLNLISAGVPLPVSLRILGFELSDDDWNLIERSSPNFELRNELRKWRRKALGRFKDGKKGVVEFVTSILPEHVIEYVKSGLMNSENVSDVNSVFDRAELLIAGGDTHNDLYNDIKRALEVYLAH